MLRTLGALLVVAAFTMAGLIRARELKAEARLLAAMVSALEIMQGEITGRLTPLPELAERLARAGPEETRAFFALLALRTDELGEREFSEIWAGCVQKLGLDEAAADALSDLGRSLGRYGAAEQGAALSRCIEGLGALAAQAAERARSGGRLSTCAGVTIGLLLTVALL